MHINSCGCQRTLLVLRVLVLHFITSPYCRTLTIPLPSTRQRWPSHSFSTQTNTLIQKSEAAQSKCTCKSHIHSHTVSEERSAKVFDALQFLSPDYERILLESKGFQHFEKITAIFWCDRMCEQFLN